MSDSTLDSGHNIHIQTARPSDDVCVAGNAILEARDAFGRLTIIDLRSVRGTAYVEPTVVVDGRLLGSPVLGACP